MIEHFRTRTTPDRPIRVLSVTIFADLKPLILALPNENPTVSIAIIGPEIGYVQTKPSSKSMMTKWISSATWEPVPGGCEFLADMDRPNDLSLSWYKLPKFGELGLTIGAAPPLETSDPSRSRILIPSRLVTVVLVCRGKPQPIRRHQGRGKSAAKDHPATNESKKRKPNGSIRRRPGRFPPAAIAGLAIVCCVLCKICYNQFRTRFDVHAADNRF